MASILVMWSGSFEQTFVSPSQGGPKWNLALTGPVVSEEKKFENVDDDKIWVTLDQGQRMTLTSDM